MVKEELMFSLLNTIQFCIHIFRSDLYTIKTNNLLTNGKLLSIIIVCEDDKTEATKKLGITLTKFNT